MTLVLCKNGLHEIDPNDPWRGNDRSRCKSCFKVRGQRRNRSAQLDGRASLSTNRYFTTEKGAESRKRAHKKWNHSSRHKAHNLCKKYGVPLSFFDDLGHYPPDVQEALNGSS